jgi:hypothetical protein
MAPRQFPDPTKARAAAVTMVRGDAFFLRRWVDYYGGLLGRENLFVFAHGNDPEVRRIAAGASVLGLPYDPTRYRFDRRRWQMLGDFTSGLLRYYNWVLCGDVDEIVVADPEVAPDPFSYLDALPAKSVPKVTCPLGIEIVHNPALEPEPLDEGAAILSRRRLFRLNSNYSKPSLTRVPIQFSPGGHSCNVDERTVDPHLYLVHLRFVSHDLTLARLSERQAMKAAMTEAAEAAPKRTIWERDAETYLELSKQAPVAETVDFADFRRAMVEKKKAIPEKNIWFFGGGRSKDLYRLPPRFAALV